MIRINSITGSPRNGRMSGLQGTWIMDTGYCRKKQEMLWNWRSVSCIDWVWEDLEPSENIFSFLQWKTQSSPEFVHNSCRVCNSIANERFGPEGNTEICTIGNNFPKCFHSKLEWKFKQRYHATHNFFNLELSFCSEMLNLNYFPFFSLFLIKLLWTVNFISFSMAMNHVHLCLHSF